MKRLVKSPAERGRVAEKQEMGAGGGHRPLDRLKDVLAHPGRLVDDEQDVALMEALEPLGLVCRDAVGVVLVP